MAKKILPIIGQGKTQAAAYSHLSKQLPHPIDLSALRVHPEETVAASTAYATAEVSHEQITGGYMARFEYTLMPGVPNKVVRRGTGSRPSVLGMSAKSIEDRL